MKKKKILFILALLLTIVTQGAWAQTNWNVTHNDASDKTDWTIAPTSTTVGSTVTVSYSGPHKVKNVTVEKKWRTLVVTAPTANNRTYDGTTQALLTGGSTTGGTLQYSLTSGTGYSTTVPTATNAGSYTVYYKVVGDEAYNDVAEQSVGVTISKAAATLTCNNSAISYSASEDTNSTKTKTGVSCSGGTISVASANTGNCTVSYSNGTITITRKTNSAFSNTTVTVSVTPDANHTAPSNVTFNVSATEAYTDLSKIDCAGNDRSSMWTANCYMIQKAGKYKLPLVYGNAIKNGADNTTAYKPGGTTSTNYCANFVNHANKAISAPWITKPTNGSGVNKGMGYNVTSAELLWQDVNGLITAVGIDGHYLTLTVGKDATTAEGNAVIAAKVGSTIVWSWHIWVTKQTFATLSTVTTSYHTYKVIPVYLGFVGNNSGDQPWCCTYYQWGRKDPLPPNNGYYGVSDHTIYDINGSTLTASNLQNKSDATIGDNIQNPIILYNTGDNRDRKPCNVDYYNMWDAQQTGDASYNDPSYEEYSISTATKKTIYDPCPPGFCVPTNNLLAFLRNRIVNADIRDSARKRKYTGTSPVLYFPATGMRTTGSGEIYYPGYYGYLWSATA